MSCRFGCLRINLYFCGVMKKTFILLCVLVCYVTYSNARIRLPQIFQNGMVLQRGMPIPVWGWADPQENVVVTLNESRRPVHAGGKK